MKKLLLSAFILGICNLGFSQADTKGEAVILSSASDKNTTFIIEDGATGEIVEMVLIIENVSLNPGQMVTIIKSGKAFLVSDIRGRKLAISKDDSGYNPRGVNHHGYGWGGLR